MSIRQTIQIGHPALKAVNQQITDVNDPQVVQLIADLKETMVHNQLFRLAAPQIAENYQLFVTEPRETASRPADQTDILRVYINPTLVTTSPEEIEIYEGCGSVLNGQLFGPVSRSQTITIEATDETGTRFRLTTDGILGRVIQHEYDHLQGVEFLEKVNDYKKMMTVDFYVQNVKNDPKHMEASRITTIEHEYV